MKKKGLAIGILVFLFSAGMLYTSVGSRSVGQKAWEYLESKGYAQQDIQSLKVRHSFLNLLLSYHEWTVEVIYADEPASQYDFYLQDGVILGGGVSGTTEKEDLKHGTA